MDNHYLIIIWYKKVGYCMKEEKLNIDKNSNRLIIDLDKLPEDNKEALMNTLKTQDFDKINSMMDFLNIPSFYKEEFEKHGNVDNIAYIIEGKQYNFQLAKVDTKHFKKGRYYLSMFTPLGIIIASKDYTQEQLKDAFISFPYLYGYMNKAKD